MTRSTIAARAIEACTIAFLAAALTQAPAAFAQDAAAMSSPAPTEAASAVPTAPRPAGVPDPAPVHPELAGVFAQFGGKEGMTALMEDFMAIMLEDPRTKPFFEHADQPRIKRQLAEQFCVILDGGCTYSGRDMQTAHAALGLDRADFNALVEDLQIAMNLRKIPFRAQNKLLAVLAPMHREVISR